MGSASEYQSGASGPQGEDSFLTVSTISASQTGLPGFHYHVDTAAVTLTLPAAPAVDDQIAVSCGTFTNTVVARNGSNIGGLAEDLTLDREDAYVEFRYINATVGWGIISFTLNNSTITPTTIFLNQLEQSGATDGQIPLYNSTSGFWEASDLEGLPASITSDASAPAGSLAIDAVGTTTVIALVESSSLRYKENVRGLEGDVIGQLIPVTYTRKLTGVEEDGFIAEDVASIAPNLVAFDPDGNPDGINYTRIIAHLVKKVQELEAKING